MVYTGGMKVIIGLGNPEKQYTGTRHNVGFEVLDLFATHHGATFTPHPKFKALVASLTLGGEKVLLAKPTTYYNLVGESARAIIDFYKLAPDDVLIIHDDLALPLGTVRTRIGGSDGGNNGLKSMNAHLGQSTARVRVGVWTDTHHSTDKVSVVLGKFSQAERAVLSNHESTIATCIHSFITVSFETTTHRVVSDTK